MYYVYCDYCIPFNMTKKKPKEEEEEAEQSRTKEYT